MAIAHDRDCVALVKATGNPLTSVLTYGSAIAAGATVFVLINQQSGSNRTYVVTDSIAGALTKIFESTHVTGYACNIELWAFVNHPGGTPTITVTHGQGSADFAISSASFTEFGSVLNLLTIDIVDEVSTGNSHQSSALGVTEAGACLALVCGATAGPNFTDSVVGSGYAKIPAGYTDTDYYFAYKLFPSGCSNELGSWTHTGTARDVTSFILLLGTTGDEGGGGGSSLLNLNFFDF